MNTADNPLLRPRNPFDRRVVQAIAAAKPSMSVGIIEKPLPGGRSLTPLSRGRRSTTSAIHPFYIYQRTGLLHAGTVNGVIPHLGGDPIGEDGNALTLSGDRYIYLRAEYTLVFGTLSLLSATPITDAYTVISSATEEVDSFAIDTLITFRLVAQLIDGRVQREQQTKTLVGVSVCDDSDGTSEGRRAKATWGAA